MATLLREIRASDRSPLAEVLRSDETFRHDEVAVAIELIDDALANSDSDYWFQIAEVDGRVVGYICYGPTPMTQSTYDLYWVVVHSEMRGRGLARTLIGAMEDALSEGGATGIRVETSTLEGYGSARNLYDRLGYPKTAVFTDFYRPGDDLLVYYKRL